MPTLQLFVALSGLAVTVVLSQLVAFGNPPPLPTTGTFLIAGMHEQSYTHVLWCDLPLIQKRVHIISFHSYHTVPCLNHVLCIGSSNFDGQRGTANNLNHGH